MDQKKNNFLKIFGQSLFPCIKLHYNDRQIRLYTVI